MFTVLIRKEKRTWWISPLTSHAHIKVKGLLYRRKGPAIEWTDGTKEWLLYGKRHCRNYPALERPDGTKQWWVNGRLSRSNFLPAVEYADGDKEWWYNGEQYGVEENGIREFFNHNKKLHSYGNLPAIEYSNGDKEWWFDGKRHREDGPAVTIGDKQFWFEYGVFIKCSLF